MAGESIKATLTKKIGGVPVYVMVAIGLLALVWYMQRHKGKGSDKAAADATNIGSADNLAGMSTEGQPMPFQGGDIILNISGDPSKPTGAGPAKPLSAHQKHVAHQQHKAHELAVARKPAARKKTTESVHQKHVAHKEHVRHTTKVAHPIAPKR